MKLMLASAAAQEMRLRPKVERWSPGLKAAAISGLRGWPTFVLFSKWGTKAPALARSPQAVPFRLTNSHSPQTRFAFTISQRHRLDGTP